MHVAHRIGIEGKKANNFNFTFDRISKNFDASEVVELNGDKVLICLLQFHLVGCVSLCVCMCSFAFWLQYSAAPKLQFVCYCFFLYADIAFVVVISSFVCSFVHSIVCVHFFPFPFFTVFLFPYSSFSISLRFVLLCFVLFCFALFFIRTIRGWINKWNNKWKTRKQQEQQQTATIAHRIRLKTKIKRTENLEKKHTYTHTQRIHVLAFNLLSIRFQYREREKEKCEIDWLSLALSFSLSLARLLYICMDELNSNQWSWSWIISIAYYTQQYWISIFRFYFVFLFFVSKRFAVLFIRWCYQHPRYASLLWLFCFDFVVVVFSIILIWNRRSRFRFI